MSAFSITVEDTANTPIPSASVGIFDSVGVPVMSTVTDSDGIALLVTNEQEVAVRVSKAGYLFDGNLSIQPVDNATYTISGTATVVSPPIDANMCRVYGTIRDPLSNELSSRWRFKLSRVGVVGDAHTDHIVTGEANVPHDKGLISIDLVKNSNYNIGPLPISRYGDISYEDLAFVEIKVPDRSIVNLVDLIAPIAYALNTTQASVSLSKDSLTELELALELTDGTLDAAVDKYIFAEVDTGNVSVSVSGGILKIYGEALGDDKITLFGSRDINSVNGTFYRPSTPKILLEIEVSCVP